MDTIGWRSTVAHVDEIYGDTFFHSLYSTSFYLVFFSNDPTNQIAGPNYTHLTTQFDLRT